MSHEEVLDRIKENKHNKVKFAIADSDGVLRGKYIHKDKFFQGVESSLGFCDVIFGWDVADQAYQHAEVTGWHTGYPDKQVRLDLGSFRTIPWEDDLPFFLGDFYHEPNPIQAVCPRTLLRKISEQCAALGYLPLFTQEFEWFTFRETAEDLERKGFQRPVPLTPGMFGYSLLRPSLHPAFHSDLFRQLEQFRVPLEALHTETGPGVYEACTMPQPVVEAADQAILLKAAVKEIGHRHGLIASFMAKWNAELPGCSGHLHQSLWDPGREKNLFSDAAAADGMSELMKSYLAGQLKCLPFILPMYAPTVNSYKRLVEGAWAPTTVTWGMDNRTTAFRILNVTPKLTRIETRIPGADVNPYLAMAASLASGLYGLKNNLKLSQVATTGNGYADKAHGSIASNLREATALMRDSEIPATLFGEGFVKHFTYTREWEWDQFSRQVTDFELKRYFEII